MRSDLLALIHTDRLAHNLSALRGCCRPGVKVCAPLKANAYGHGVGIVAPALQAAGADFAAVASLQEAVELRAMNWHLPILVLGHVMAVADAEERRERLAVIRKHDLIPTVADEAAVLRLSDAAFQTPPPAPPYQGGRRASLHGGSKTRDPTPITVHIKIDTGMGRMGCTPEDAPGLVEQVLAAPGLRIGGFYSHFATADFEQLDLARRQLDTFRKVLDRVGPMLPPGVILHLANSAATITLPEAHFDMVRPGLALYGYPPARHMAERIDLRPALRLVTHLSMVKNLPTGHCVGYGQSFTTHRPTRLGIAPAGYFDGFTRKLGNNTVVGTAYGPAPVVGRISMDAMAVDLTDLPPLEPGAEITLIDDQPGRPNSVEVIAERLGTIPYEVTCLLGQRVQRVAVR